MDEMWHDFEEWEEADERSRRERQRDGERERERKHDQIETRVSDCEKRGRKKEETGDKLQMLRSSSD